MIIKKFLLIVGLSGFSGLGFAGEFKKIRSSSYDTLTESNNIERNMIKSYVLIQEGGIKMNITCETAFDVLENAFINDLSNGPFYYDSFVGILCENDGTASGFQIGLVAEAKNQNSLNEFQKYLATHDGQKIWGFEFRFEMAVGVAQTLNVKSGLLSINDEDFNLHKHDQKLTNHANLGDAVSTDKSLYNKFLGEPDEVIDVLTVLLGEFAGDEYPEVMRTVNFMTAETKKLIILPDGRSYELPYIDSYERDCRESTSGYCLD